MENNKDVKNRVAEIHGVTRRYVNQILSGERSNDQIKNTYHMLKMADEKVDQIVKTIVKQN